MKYLNNRQFFLYKKNKLQLIEICCKTCRFKPASISALHLKFLFCIIKWFSNRKKYCKSQQLVVMNSDCICWLIQ